VLILRNAHVRLDAAPGRTRHRRRQLPSPGSRRRSSGRLGVAGRKGRTGIRLCPPAMTNASGFDASRSICFAKGAGGLVIEGRGFHCYTSRRKAEPSNCMPSVPGERRVRDPLNGRTSIANSQPRSRPGEDQQMRTRLPRHDAMRSAPAGPDRVVAALGLSGRGVVGWARLCRCLRCSTPTALSTPQLRRPDLSTPGLARRFPRNARPARTPRTERSQRFGRGEDQLQQVYLSAQGNIESMKVHSLYRT